MMQTGLVSVTFRQLGPEQIVELVARAGLDGVEWGGDVHVPHGDIERARQVRIWTEQAGLTVASYGSYYRVGHQDPMPFEPILETAVALGAPGVRVWAGKLGSAEADQSYRDRVVADSQRIADLAQQAGLGIAYEYHGHTLTDTKESALQLIQEAGRTALSTYWQVLAGEEEPQLLTGLRAVLPWLSNVHVQGRPSLQAHAGVWPARLDVVRTTGRDHWVLIEFVRDDDPEAFMRDAETLKSWLVDTGGGEK